MRLGRPKSEGVARTLQALCGHYSGRVDHSVDHQQRIPSRMTDDQSCLVVAPRAADFVREKHVYLERWPVGVELGARPVHRSALPTIRRETSTYLTVGAWGS